MVFVPQSSKAVCAVQPAAWPRPPTQVTCRLLLLLPAAAATAAALIYLLSDVATSLRRYTGAAAAAAQLKAVTDAINNFLTAAVAALNAELAAAPVDSGSRGARLLVLPDFTGVVAATVTPPFTNFGVDWGGAGRASLVDACELCERASVQTAQASFNCLA